METHTDVHVAALITMLGVLLGTRAFPATAAGYAALLTWARAHGHVRRAGVESTSPHGTRTLSISVRRREDQHRAGVVT
ncbi:hypothetical protein [Sphaerisporangium flaviroseum]|uniref:hypothetical protein n=1 Tax=Sphaerisporangium flaviroseum TaxID=509199 RepID=UPI0031E687F6